MKFFKVLTIVKICKECFSWNNAKSSQFYNDWNFQISIKKSRIFPVFLNSLTILNYKTFFHLTKVKQQKTFKHLKIFVLKWVFNCVQDNTKKKGKKYLTTKVRKKMRKYINIYFLHVRKAALPTFFLVY